MGVGRAVAAGPGSAPWPGIAPFPSERSVSRVSADRHERVDGVKLAHELEALHPRCFGWALACCDWNVDDAADTLQAAYLKILDGGAKFEGRSQLSTFVYGVVRRTAGERRRGRARRLRLLTNHFARRLDEQPSDFLPRLPGEVLRLRRALQGLPERQREVLHLVFYADLSIREAAEVMRVSIGTARTHYERGKQKLRDRLEEERPEDARR